MTKTAQMKKSLACLTLTLFAGSASVANAGWQNYMPSSGAPYVGGTSSFDWSNWSFADGVLTNNATTSRTWTLPMMLDDDFIGNNEGVYGVMKVPSAGQGTTTAQIAANNLNGVRVWSGTVISPTCGGAGTYCDTNIGPFPQTAAGMTVYVNYVVGKGNSIARTAVHQ